MCRHTTMVAQLGDYQYLAYCEHSTIHLGWRYGTFHLQPVDFLRIVCLLERMAVEPDLIEIKDEGRCCLIRQQNGCCQLWLGNALLFLTPADLLKLLELLRLAIPRLGHILVDGLDWPEGVPQSYGGISQGLSGASFGVN